MASIYMGQMRDAYETVDIYYDADLHRIYETYKVSGNIVAEGVLTFDDEMELYERGYNDEIITKILGKYVERLRERGAL